jgi:hypothetical protein
LTAGGGAVDGSTGGLYFTLRNGSAIKGYQQSPHGSSCDPVVGGCRVHDRDDTGGDVLLCARANRKKRKTPYSPGFFQGEFFFAPMGAPIGIG